MLIVSVSLHSSWTLKSQLRKEPLKDIWFTSGRHLTFTEQGRIYPMYPLIQDRRCTWSLSESRFVLLLRNSPKKQIPHPSPFCKSLFLNETKLLWFYLCWCERTAGLQPFHEITWCRQRNPCGVCPWSLFSFTVYQPNFLSFSYLFSLLFECIHPFAVTDWQHCSTFSKMFQSLFSLNV